MPIASKEKICIYFSIWNTFGRLSNQNFLFLTSHAGIAQVNLLMNKFVMPTKFLWSLWYEIIQFQCNICSHNLHLYLKALIRWQVLCSQKKGNVKSYRWSYCICIYLIFSNRNSFSINRNLLQIDFTKMERTEFFAS